MQDLLNATMPPPISHLSLSLRTLFVWVSWPPAPSSPLPCTSPFIFADLQDRFHGTAVPFNSMLDWRSRSSRQVRFRRSSLLSGRSACSLSRSSRFRLRFNLLLFLVRAPTPGCYASEFPFFSFSKAPSRLFGTPLKGNPSTVSPGYCVPVSPVSVLQPEF